MSEMPEVLVSFGYDEAPLLWLKEHPHRHLIFVLEEERAFADPAIKVYFLETPLQIGSLAKQIGWATVFWKLQIRLFRKSEEAFLFQKELERVHLAAHLLLSEASDYHVGALKNALANQTSFRRGLGLGGAFKGVPAVIVGAGPSLKKNGHLLASLQNKALILAGGSALNSDLGVEPHFAASIDREAPFAQFKKHPFFEVPFCYQSRMNRDNFSLIHGEKLLFPDSSSAAINWLQGDEALFNGGWTVSNFLTAFATLLGCNPIVFVGMDLCYQDGKKYADLESALPEGLIQVGDVWTQSDWLMSAIWTEELAAANPATHFINATEGGLGFKAPVAEASLAALNAELPEQGYLKKRVHEAIQELPLESMDPERAKIWAENLESGGDGVVCEKLLMPLWQIWKPLFERELESDETPLPLEEKLKIHQTLFFEQILQEHR